MEINKTVIVASRWFLYYVSYITITLPGAVRVRVQPDCSHKTKPTGWGVLCRWTMRATLGQQAQNDMRMEKNTQNRKHASKYYSGEEVNKGKMGGACGTRVAE